MTLDPTNLAATVNEPLLPDETPRTVAARTPDRITVSGSIYHQSGGGAAAVAVPVQYGRWLTTEEQPYQRTMRVGTHWVPLDHGWLSQASLLIVENREGRDFAVIPTAAERDAVATRVVELGVVPEPPDPASLQRRTQHDSPLPPPADPVAFAEVHPGEATPGFTPVALNRLRVRCRSESAKITITLFPV